MKPAVPDGLRRCLGWLLGLIVWLWVRSWRVRVLLVEPGLLDDPEARVLAFFHGHQMGLLAVRRRPTAVLVSRSRDGELQSGVMRANGLLVMRGSSSRGGAEGLRSVMRALGRGCDAAVAVDGPRGPRHRAKPGAAYAAVHAEARLVPVATAPARALTLRSWDRFEIPWPFSRVAVVVGRAVEPDRALADPEHLSMAIVAARRYAEQLIADPATPARRAPRGTPFRQILLSRKTGSVGR